MLNRTNPDIILGVKDVSHLLKDGETIEVVVKREADSLAEKLAAEQGNARDHAAEVKLRGTSATIVTNYRMADPGQIRMHAVTQGINFASGRQEISQVTVTARKQEGIYLGLPSILRSMGYQQIPTISEDENRTN